MQSWQSFCLHRGALFFGVLVGMGAVLFVTGATALAEPGDVGFVDVLMRLAFIYGGAGLATGIVVEREEQRHGRARRYAPTGLHSCLAALAVTLGHALVLLAVHQGDFAYLAFFAAEAFIVTVLAGVVGSFAGEALRLGREVLRVVHPATA